MRKNKLALPLLVLLLLVGGGIGAWFVMQDTGGGNGPDVGRVDDGDQDGPADGQDPDLLGVDSGDQQTPPEKQPGNGGDTTNNNNGGESNTTSNANNGNGESNTTSNNGSEQPAKTDWSPVKHELTISGRVRFKSDGTPAVGADVTAEEAEDTNVNWRGMVEVETFENKDRPKMKILGSTTTDGAGEFTLTLKVTTWQRAGDKDATPERDREAWGGSFGNAIRVVATMAGYAPARSNNIFLGGQTEQRVELELAVPTLLRGRVVDAETRQGIAGARGSLFDSEGAGRGLNSRSFVTDENGYFVINDLPESTYGLTLNADGYANWNGWENVGRLILKGGEERDLGEITMQKAAGITGKVIDAETGEPVVGASVSAESGGRWGGNFARSTITGEDGSFELSGVEPGTYKVKAGADGYAQVTLEAQTVEPGKGLDVGVIKLGTGISINGRISDGRGTPVAEAVVKISEPREGFDFGPQSSLQSTASDAEGFYRLAGLSEGSFTLTVTGEGYAEYSETVTIEGEGQRIDVTLQMGGTVTGRVLDSTGAPVMSATVAVIDHDSQAYTIYKMNPGSVMGMAMWGGAVSAQTDESGSFELANVPAGTYLLVGSKEGSSAHKDNLEIENERKLNAGDLRFAGNGSVRVIVTEDGQSVPDLAVSLTQGMGWGGGAEHKEITDSTGTALLKDVPEGTYYVMTERDEGGFDTDRTGRSVKVKTGETVEFQLELRPKDGVHLHGRLTMNGEATLETVTLVGKGERKSVVKSADTERGYYEFVGLKPGLYTLYARASDTSVACRIELDLSREGDHPLDRDFKGYVVSGTVSTPENTAAQYAATQLVLKSMGEDDDATFASWLSGRGSPGNDGGFEFADVPPGKYRLTATLEGVGSSHVDVELVGGSVSGLSLNVTNNSGSVKVTISKLDGSAVSGAGFGTFTLTDSQGNAHEFADPQQSMLMINEGAAGTASTVAPGTWTVEVRGSGYLTRTVSNVIVKKGEVTEVKVELTAGAALYLTTTNGEITQEMLDNAKVRYLDAQGAELKIESNVFDSWAGSTETFEAPTLVARYIGMDVAEVRIKLDAYAELVIPVSPTPGKKIEKQETLIVE